MSTVIERTRPTEERGTRAAAAIEAEPDWGWKAILVARALLTFAVAAQKQWPAGATLRFRHWPPAADGTRGREVLETGTVSREQFVPWELVTQGVCAEVSRAVFDATPAIRRYPDGGRLIVAVPFHQIVTGEEE